MFIEEGHSYFESSSKCIMYEHLCGNFKLQEYLKKKISNVHVQFISKISSYRLEFERGRFYNIHKNEKILNYVHYHRLKMRFILF